MFAVKKNQFKMIPGEDGRTKVCDYWTTAKNTVLTATLLKDLQTYKKDEIPPEVIT